MEPSRNPDPTQLGDLESEVMRVLWKRGEGSVPEVKSGIRWPRDLAYTTVMTVLTRLVDKGLLARRKEGRFYVYRPLVERQAMARSALRRVVDRFFDGLNQQAVAELLAEDGGLTEGELRHLEALVREAREAED